MNIMLLFLSEYREDSEERVYKDSLQSIEITGKQTSDAPTKYFLEYIKKKRGESLDKIFCITSKKVYQNGLEQYKEMVAEYCENNGLQAPEIIPIAYDFDMSSTEVEESDDLSVKVNRIYQGIIEKLEYIEKEEIHVYIDYTGGLRDISFLMVVLMRYLEFIGLYCEKVIYVNLSQQKIVSIDYIYQLFHVINGISEFIQNGSSVLLRDTVLHNKQVEEKYPSIKELLDAMNDFSDVIALCVVDKNMDTVLTHLREAIKKVQAIDVSRGTEDEIAIHMLKNLLGEIEKKLLVEGTGEVSYIKIIRWCLENNLIQQAITFYIEKMPKIYYEKKLINEFNKMAKVLPGHDAYSVQFYEILFDEIGQGKGFEAFRSLVGEMVENGKRLNVEKFLENRGEVFSENVITKIEKAQERVNRYLDLRYDWYGKRQRLQSSDKVFLKISNKINANERSGALNQIRNNLNVLAMFFENEVQEKKETSTYEKKLVSIQRLDNAEEHDFGKISNTDLKEILEYYLTLKIIRNQINHANENEEDGNGIEAVEKYLKQEQRGYTTEIRSENIKTLLQKAIDKSEQLCLKEA